VDLKADYSRQVDRRQVIRVPGDDAYSKELFLLRSENGLPQYKIAPIKLARGTRM